MVLQMNANQSAVHYFDVIHLRRQTNRRIQRYTLSKKAEQHSGNRVDTIPFFSKVLRNSCQVISIVAASSKRICCSATNRAKPAIQIQLSFSTVRKLGGGGGLPSAAPGCSVVFASSAVLDFAAIKTIKNRAYERTKTHTIR